MSLLLTGAFVAGATFAIPCSFRGWFNFGFNRYRNARWFYQHRVLNGQMSYHRFCEKIQKKDNLGWALTANVKIDRKEKLTNLSEITRERRDLIDTFFSQKTFRFRYEYKQMCREWELHDPSTINQAQTAESSPDTKKSSQEGIDQHATAPTLSSATIELPSNTQPKAIKTTQTPSFCDFITISDTTKKEQVLSNIQIYLLANKKGRSIALLIAALCQLNYLARTTPIAPFLRYMAAHYKEKLGAPQGVTSYINKDKSHKFKETEISSMIQLLNKQD